MTITTFQQTALPDVGVTVTEISQDIIPISFNDWFRKCCKITSFPETLDYRVFKTYYNEDLTPSQAVKKYFL